MRCSLALLLICLLFSPLRSVADSIKIVNWNVLYGFSALKTFDAGAEWLVEQSPDVVALQELNGISEKKLRELAGHWNHKFVATNKESGFPVGLTSKYPITLIERQSVGYHHGFLHVKTKGINYFVVHFWPGKFHEMDEITERIKPILDSGEYVIVLGDFNGCSRKDKEFLATVKTRDIEYNYTEKLEALKFVDIVHKHDPAAKISCPSPITIPRWSENLKVLKSKQYRIDFIFADDHLAKFSTQGTISLDKRIDKISDHYPVIARFSLPKEPLESNSQ